MKILYCLLALFFVFESECVPIETPDQPERNRFVIRAPSGWGYRTFKGTNGLIGVLWPEKTSFNESSTAVFVFMQNLDDVLLPETPENIQLFQEKCPKSTFKFTSTKKDEDKTLSIEEKYFSGFCGRTEILFEEKVKNLRIITVVASSFYISQEMFDDIKYVVSAYRDEVRKEVNKGNMKIISKQIKTNNSNLEETISETSKEQIVLPNLRPIDPLINRVNQQNLNQSSLNQGNFNQNNLNQENFNQNNFNQWNLNQNNMMQNSLPQGNLNQNNFNRNQINQSNVPNWNLNQNQWNRRTNGNVRIVDRPPTIVLP